MFVNYLFIIVRYTVCMNKILIIEDSVSFRHLLVQLFHANGYDTVDCDNGKSGLQEMLVGTYRAIILDLNVPVIDGIQVLTQYYAQKKKIERNPVVVLSGQPKQVLKDISLKKGASAFIEKDKLDFHYLLELVGQF